MFTERTKNTLKRAAHALLLIIVGLYIFAAFGILISHMHENHMRMVESSSSENARRALKATRRHWKPIAAAVVRRRR